MNSSKSITLSASGDSATLTDAFLYGGSEDSPLEGRILETVQPLQIGG
jgi:hypothetical protein